MQDQIRHYVTSEVQRCKQMFHKQEQECGALLEAQGYQGNVNDAKATVSGIGNGDNVLVWTISNGVCRTSSDTVRLIGADIPIVDAGQDTTIFEDNGYQLSVSTDIPVSDYRWDPVFSLDNAAIQRPFARPTETTTYNGEGYN